MTRSRLTRFLPAAILGLTLVPLTAGAQPPARPDQPSPQVPQRVAPARTPVPVRTVTESEDARKTRTELERVMNRYSPALAGVLKLDPSLLANPDYLAPYPGLAEFLAQHPEVARDPAYFFEEVELPWVASRRTEPFDPRREGIRVWRDAMETILMFVSVLLMTATLVWLVKTLIDYRRWSRLSKVQADVHNKVLDRFTHNEELLAYVQTPAGRRFLESAPIMLDAAAPAMASPVRRILWAVEAGFVLMAGGVGVQFVSGRAPVEVASMLFAIGVLGVALGIGFILAAGVSFFISRRLGLLSATLPVPARERENV